MLRFLKILNNMDKFIAQFAVVALAHHGDDLHVQRLSVPGELDKGPRFQFGCDRDLADHGHAVIVSDELLQQRSAVYIFSGLNIYAAFLAKPL